MMFVDQDKFGTKEGNCFSACVASIMDLRLEDVPFFMGPGEWYPRFRDWLKTYGCYPLHFTIDGNTLDNMSHYGVYILSGKSPRPEVPYPECMHSVLACGDKVIHDPHPSRDGVETYDDFILIVKGVR